MKRSPTRGGNHAARLLLAGVAVVCLSSIAAGQDELERRRERLAAMSPLEHERLMDKKGRFDGLEEEQRNRLRKAHQAVSSAPDSQRLQETLANFTEWLGTLSGRERTEVLDPKVDADKRIARIKELIQQQEEERFREYVGTLPPKDRETLNAWLMEFVERHADKIEENMSREWRSRYRDLDDQEAKSNFLFGSWMGQYFRQHPDVPKPTSGDIDKLIADLTDETRRQINQAAAPEQREQRARDLVRALTVSRSVPPVSRDELEKFYTEMKRDDPRRDRLEGLAGDQLYRELQVMYSLDRWQQLGGQPFGRWSRGGPGRGGPGRGGQRGGPSPPAFGQPVPPPGSRDSRPPRDENRAPRDENRTPRDSERGQGNENGTHQP